MSAEYLEPIEDNVVIEPSGVGDESTWRGTILAVGPGMWYDGVRHPMATKAGDVVVYDKRGVDAVRVNGRDLIVASENRLLGIIRTA